VSSESRNVVRRRLWESASLAAKGFLDFVYPPRCVLCDRDQPSGDGPSTVQPLLCQDCRTKLIPANDNPCRRCGVPLGPYTKSDKEGCLVCRNQHFAFREVIRLGAYRDELRIACLMAKNPNGRLLGLALTRLFIETKSQQLNERQFNLVVPVPEHWFKRWTRPQYAAETIARELSRQLQIPLGAQVLEKHRWTPKQATSTPVERRHQQQGVFRTARKQELNGQSILLVDDILTTGATADEAARCLKRAGAKQVTVAVLAVSPPR